MDLAVGLGGAITGEHGVGRVKRPWLAGQLGPEAMELNQRIKRALDPDGTSTPARQSERDIAQPIDTLPVAVVPMRHDGHSVSRFAGPVPAR